MLSRVAESIYWMARYLERAENTARMVMVNANLLLDLPKGAQPEWQPLVTITGATDQFEAEGRRYEERAVVMFLLGDRDYAGSVINSLRAARENARTIRDIMPREAREQINELNIYARDNLDAGLSKRGRHLYLKRLILGVQTITGMFSGTMTKGGGYQFLVMGRSIERADMTTRIIDVRSADLLEDSPDLRPFRTIQWVSVLKSLTAYQMYRQSRQARVTRSEVLRFLFQDTDFPRSVFHCVTSVERGADRLPRHDGVLRQCGRLKRMLVDSDVGALRQDHLHEFVDSIQLNLAELHTEIARTWFLLDPEAEQAQIRAVHH
ncbi:MAG: alpha-E domain-containing protein [Gammaproteobacteria bacterium]|nr:alpha-E domain-containing protein [Gammaproteobacteria bacterium]